MTKKRNPTEHTEERSGSAAAPGSQNVPGDAEQAEYADYSAENAENAEGTEKSRRGKGNRDGGSDREAEARREAELQPGGEPRSVAEKAKEEE